MKYAFFTNTPAHVHLYKHVATRLQAAGHEVLVLLRDYGCTEALASWHDLPYTVYGRCETTKFSLVRELPRHYAGIIRSIRGFDPDLIFGVGAYAAHAGLVSRTPVVLVLDSEPTRLDHYLSRPFANALLTPRSFRKDLGSRHFVFDGFGECAYLHPDVFQARPDVRDLLDLGPDERYAILRFNAFGSSHDVGRTGFSPAQRRELVTRLAADVTVFVSDEGGDLDLEALPARKFDLHPAQLHDALAGAALLVADTQTMVTEAALLGTPAVRSNSFVGEADMGNFLELERQDLVRNVAEFDTVLDVAATLLETNAKQEWQRRRDAFMADRVNLTDLFEEVARNPTQLEHLSNLTRRSEVSTGLDPVPTSIES